MSWTSETYINQSNSLYIKRLCSCVQAIFLWWTPNRYQAISRCRGWWEEKMRGRSWVHSLLLIFYRGTPFSLRIMGGKIKYCFLAFSTEKRANFDYNRVFGHGEFNDDIYNLCTTTQGCHPRRHQGSVSVLFIKILKIN
jgi:hypothetical protein